MTSWDSVNGHHYFQLTTTMFNWLPLITMFNWRPLCLVGQFWLTDLDGIIEFGYFVINLKYPDFWVRRRHWILPSHFYQFKFTLTSLLPNQTNYWLQLLVYRNWCFYLEIWLYKKIIVWSWLETQKLNAKINNYIIQSQIPSRW